MKHPGKSKPRTATDRYSAILQAAERLFGERGYHGVSIDEIAAAAGVSKGLVFYHFTNKKALVEHILKDAVGTVLARWDAIAQSNKSGQAKLSAAIEACFEIFNSRPYLLRIAFFEGIFEEDMKDILATISEETVLRMDKLIKDGIATGEFRTVDSRTAAILLLLSSTIPSLQAALQPQAPLPFRRVAREITGILCNGICR